MHDYLNIDETYRGVTLLEYIIYKIINFEYVGNLDKMFDFIAKNKTSSHLLTDDVRNKILGYKIKCFYTFIGVKE